MAYQHTYPEPDSGVLVKVVATFLGIAVAVLAILGIWLATSVDSGTTSTPAEHQHSDAAVAAATPSYAGVAPANADAIATAHRPYPAAMPALQPGPVATIELGIVHRVVPLDAGGRRTRLARHGQGAPDDS